MSVRYLANTKSSNSTGLGIGAGVNAGGAVSSVSAQLSTGTSYERTKTLATLGQGSVTITDTQHSSDTTNLNRDVTKVDKELYSTSSGTNVDATIDHRLFSEDGRKEMKNQAKQFAGNVINGVAFAGNILTGNKSVDNAIKSFQDPLKMAEAIQKNPKLAATLDAFTKGEFNNLPQTKEGLQALADATGLKVDVLLTTVTSYQDAKGSTDKKLIAIDVNPSNRADTIVTLEHEIDHNREGISDVPYATNTNTPSIQTGTNTANGIIIPENGIEYKIMVDSALSDIQKQLILNDLKKLTNKKLTLKNNEVVNGESSGFDKPKGTKLIDRLISSEKRVKIGIGTDEPSTMYYNLVDASNGKGTDTKVIYDPNLAPSVNVKDFITGTVILEQTPSEIVLGHELIHADHGMQGNIIDDLQTFDQGTTLKPEIIKSEEAATVGLMPNQTNKTTENDLRDEQIINQRAKY